jgi:hypothetical protein
MIRPLCISIYTVYAHLMEFLKAIGSGVTLIVVVYCDLLAAAAEHLRKRFITK